MTIRDSVKSMYENQLLSLEDLVGVTILSKTKRRQIVKKKNSTGLIMLHELVLQKRPPKTLFTQSSRIMTIMCNNFFLDCQIEAMAIISAKQTAKLNHFVVLSNSSSFVSL